MYSIGKLAKIFGLSRTTLIYYEEIGLLLPAKRTESNYRLYNDDSYRRLEKIMAYRDSGLSLDNIGKILKGNHNTSETILEDHFQHLNAEIAKIRSKQNITLKLLENKNIKQPERSLNKEQWVTILKSSGLSENDMMNWHVEFEKSRPGAHQDFLESLGMSEQEIKHIREASQLKSGMIRKKEKSK